MAIKRVFAEIAVRNFTDSVDWYTQLFDRAADSEPMDGLAEWHLVEGGGVQVFLDAERAGSSWVTLEVMDLDDRVRGIKAKGILVGPTTTATYVRIAIVTDLDGNQLTFAEALPTSP